MDDVFDAFIAEVARQSEGHRLMDRVENEYTVVAAVSDGQQLALHVTASAREVRMAIKCLPPTLPGLVRERIAIAKRVRDFVMAEEIAAGRMQQPSDRGSLSERFADAVAAQLATDGYRIELRSSPISQDSFVVSLKRSDGDTLHVKVSGRALKMHDNMGQLAAVRIAAAKYERAANRG